MKTRLVTVLAAAGVLAVAAPNDASANFHFSCPGCNTVGNGPDVYSTTLYSFTATGAYDFYASATATGTFTITLYDGVSPLHTFAGPLTYAIPSPNSFALIAGGPFTFVNGTTYYIGATDTGGACTTGQGCNLEIQMRAAGSGGPDSTVPEPASMVLLGTGLMGIATAIRRRRKQD